MKIYEIGTGYTPIPAQMGAATEIVVEELTRSLIKNGENAEIVDIQAQSRAPMDLPLSEVKVPAMFTATDVSLGLMHKLKRVAYSVCLAGYLKKLLKTATDRVVLHFHNQYNLFFALKLIPKKLLKKATVAYTVHSYVWHGAWADIEQDIKKRYFQERYCVEHADCVFVLNENTRNNLIHHTAAEAERIRLIDNGVNTDTYHPVLEEDKDALKETWGLKGKKVFVQVGSVCPRKNQLTAVQLLTPMLQRDKKVVFCYAGGVISPEYQSAITDYARKNGVQDQVMYMGERKPGAQINALYNMAEAMIFPSKAEGFSLVIVEAMSAGIPVLIPHSLQFDLADCCLCYTDAGDFADRLAENILTEEKRQTLSREVRRIVEERYAWDSVAHSYMSGFKAVIGD